MNKAQAKQIIVEESLTWHDIHRVLEVAYFVSDPRIFEERSAANKGFTKGAIYNTLVNGLAKLVQETPDALVAGTNVQFVAVRALMDFGAYSGFCVTKKIKPQPEPHHEEPVRPDGSVPQWFDRYTFRLMDGDVVLAAFRRLQEGNCSWDYFDLEIEGIDFLTADFELTAGLVSPGDGQLYAWFVDSHDQSDNSTRSFDFCCFNHGVEVHRWSFSECSCLGFHGRPDYPPRIIDALSLYVGAVG